MFLDKSFYSGIQLIYESMSTYPLNFREKGGHCRICGGQLTEDTFSHEKSVSNSWTDEAICRSKESRHICAACHFFTIGSNKMTIWNKHNVIVATDTFKTLTYNEFLDILKKDIIYPAVITLKGLDPHLTQKHIEWKSVNAISYCDQKIRIAFTGIQIFKESKIDGIAEFDKIEFLELIKTFKALAEKYILPTMLKMKKNWQKRNFIFSQLVAALQTEKNYCLTPTIFLAAFLTSFAVISDQ